jgi:chorismate lyase
MADGVAFSRQPLRREPLWAPARQWRRTAAPPGIWDWLLDTSSLTRRLQQVCGGRFHVKVLSQDWGYPLASERRVLKMKRRGERAVIREVRLMCGERPWVYARTVMPVSSLCGAQRRLGYLGNRSLGAALFADPHVRRGAVEVTRFGPETRLFGRAVTTQPPPQVLWGRRSVFQAQGKPLLVSEIFLPALFHDQARDSHYDVIDR